MSTKFNVNTCREILENVDGTQQGIQAASAKMVFWKRNSSDVVRCWENAFQKADMDKRLVLIYLANDIAQTSRRSGREYIEAFHKALPEAFRHMMKHSDERVQVKLKKLVNVWRDRNVWGHRAISLYTDLVRGVGDGQPDKAKASQESSGGVPDEMKKAVSLLRDANHAHAALQNAVQSDNSADVLEKAKALPADKGKLSAALASLESVAAAHHKYQQAQEAITSELRRLSDKHAAEKNSSTEKLHAVQQRKQEVQRALASARGEAAAATQIAGGAGVNLAAAGVPPSVPDLMSGSPGRATGQASPATHAKHPYTSPAPTSDAGSSLPVDPFAGPKGGSSMDPRATGGTDLQATPPSAPALPARVPTSLSPDSIEQLANMDPSESADLLAAIISEAPKDVAQQFGAALVEHIK